MARAPGFQIKKGMLSLYHMAYYAAIDGTPEGAALATRWKRLFTEYAALSARYLAFARQQAKLHLEPDKLIERYESLDDAFDELQERIEPLFSDLEEWAKT